MANLRDPDTGLHNELFFRELVPSRLAAARRSLRPLSIVLLSVGGPAPGEVSISLSTARAVAFGLLHTLRDSDVACRLSGCRFGLLLEDADAESAVLTVDRFRGLHGAQGAKHHLWAGVASYPTHALDGPSLLQAAADALRDAMVWPESRIELAVSA